MTRISLLLFVALGIAACNKPSDEACRKAIGNMRTLLGTDTPTSNADIEGDVRRCKGGSTKKAVDCAANAKTYEELRACDFMKMPVKKADDAGSGSAAMGSGSAAAGSADMGSAGSAGSSDLGSSSAGSAAGGSATK